jgi:putative flippase GtrA
LHLKQKLVERHSLPSPEFFRFVIGGFINTGVTYVLFLLLQQVMPYQIAYTLVYLIGILFSYWLNSRFVFRQAMTVQKAVQYPIVYVVQYVMGIVLMSILVEVLAVSPALAAPLVIIAAIPVTFVLSRFIIK